jgi:hypothetical protein
MDSLFYRPIDIVGIPEMQKCGLKYVMQTSIMIEMPLRISSPPKGKVYFQQITKLPKNPL